MKFLSIVCNSTLFELYHTARVSNPLRVIYNTNSSNIYICLHVGSQRPPCTHRRVCMRTRCGWGLCRTALFSICCDLFEAYLCLFLFRTRMSGAHLGLMNNVAARLECLMRVNVFACGDCGRCHRSSFDVDTLGHTKIL